MKLIPTSLSRRRLLGGTAAAAATTFLTPFAHGASPAHTFSIGEKDFLLDGKPLQIRCGEIHFARVPREYWQHRLRAIKAMGLNAVCAYLFWNYHEWKEGEFDWEGQRDAAEFCRLAQQEGLWVLLRPGPYSCAEWEMGGLPWWLLKHSGNWFLRTRDPRFVEPARRFLKEAGRVLAPLQVTKGGPILMVQVDNEYGFFGNDPDYMRMMRQTVLDAGFDVPLFACNPTNAVIKSHIPELFSVANFGSDPVAGFKALNAVQKGPLMCGEFYSGWFDTWGTPHKRGKTPQALRDIDYMLKENGSFSLYMAHGGTSFGLWGGADRPFRPDTSSYDYDAPISEAGWITEKFGQLKQVMTPYLAPGETLPESPAANPVISIEPFHLTHYAHVMDSLPSISIKDRSPRHIEAYDISRGLIAYRCTLPVGPAGTLEAAAVCDLGFVFVDGKQVGIMDRRHRRYRVELAARSEAVTVEILVYTIARVNFGTEIHDRKGLHGPISFTPTGSAAQPVEDWRIRAIDFGADANLPKLAWQRGRARGPAFWRGSFSVAKAADTFLDMSTWGTGIVWVNGHCLGRYWNIGPTQTMYLPGPWMKAGANEIVVLDLTQPERPVVAGLKLPVLDQLRPEKDFSRRNNGKLQIEGQAATHSGSFATGSTKQEIKFENPVQGRQFCLESIDAHDGKQFAAVAEIELLDKDGKVMNQSSWTIAYANSEETMKEDGSALNAINGQSGDFWHTEWSGDSRNPKHPHRLVVDLGQNVTVSGFRYTPRQGREGVTGRIKSYRVLIGEALVGAPTFGQGKP